MDYKFLNGRVVSYKQQKLWLVSLKKTEKGNKHFCCLPSNNIAKKKRN